MLTKYWVIDGEAPAASITTEVPVAEVSKTSSKFLETVVEETTWGYLQKTAAQVEESYSAQSTVSGSEAEAKEWIAQKRSRR